MRWDAASLWPYGTGHTGLKSDRGCKITTRRWIADVHFLGLMRDCNIVWEFEGWDILIIWIFHKQVFLYLFCDEKRGGLWMVRYPLYKGGRRLIFASDKYCKHDSYVSVSCRFRLLDYYWVPSSNWLAFSMIDCCALSLGSTLLSEVSRTSSLLDLRVPCGWET